MYVWRNVTRVTRTQGAMEHNGVVRIGRLQSGHEIREPDAFRTSYVRKCEEGAIEVRSASCRIRIRSHPFCTRFVFVRIGCWLV